MGPGDHPEEMRRARYRWAVVVLALIAVLVTTVAVVPFVLIFGDIWLRDVQLPRGFTQERWAASPDRRQYLADDLISKRLLIGKTQAQCYRLLGSPDMTSTVSDYFSSEPATTSTEGTTESTYETVTIPGDTPETIRAFFDLGPKEPIPETLALWVLGDELERPGFDGGSVSRIA